MAVNTRTEYALRALLEIADSSREAVSAKKICQRQALPKKYIEHLLADLNSLNPNCNINAKRFCPEGHCPLSSFFRALGIKIDVILTQYTLAEIYNAWKGEKCCNREKYTLIIV